MTGTESGAADYLVGSFTGARGRGAGLTHVRLSSDGRHRATTVRLPRPLRSPSFLTVVPRDEGVDVYAIEADADAVTAIRWRIGDAEAVEVGSLATGSSPCHVAVDAATGLGVATAYGDGRVTPFVREPDGTIRPAEARDDPRRGAPGSRAHCAVIEADVVLTTDLARDVVDVWRRLPDGAIAWTSKVRLPAGTGPRHLVRTGPARYRLVGEHSGDVVTLRRAGEELVVESVTPTSPGALAGSAASEIALHPDGALLVVGLRAAGRLAVLRIEGARTRLVGDVDSRGDWPRHLLLERSRLLVAHERSHGVDLFDVGPDGGLAHRGRLDVLSPTCIVPVASPPGGSSSG